jgi:hypothetical protein
MEMLVNLVIGVVLGVIASAVFWRVLLFFKPKFEISPEAALHPETNELRIKVINRSRSYAINVRASLVIADRYLKGDAPTVEVLLELPLINGTVSALAPIQYLHKPWVPATIIFFYTDALTDELNLLLSPAKGEKRLRFTLQATHARSNTTDVKVVTYGPGDVKLGDFVAPMSGRVTGVSLAELAQRVSHDG